ncbi:hypothetical protein [Nakamurella sp.]|uniref:hypothetical protein n=1 Tax=Nakamurella sp. TaxID=1869182 RepID=UPI003B3AFD9C
MSRHWPDPSGARDAAGRRQIAAPVGPDYRLSPAAQQLVTRTADPVHAGPADATGLLRVRDITTTGAWTTPPAAADTAVIPVVSTPPPPPWNPAADTTRTDEHQEISK